MLSYLYSFFVTSIPEPPPSPPPTLPPLTRTSYPIVIPKKSNYIFTYL